MNRRRFLLSLVCLLMPGSLVVMLGRRAAGQAPPDAKKQESLNAGLIKAVRVQDANKVHALLAQGADANAPDLLVNSSRSAGVQSTATPKPPTALLIVFDEARHYTGKRVRGEAEYKQRPDPSEIVKALLEKGANPNVVDFDQTFPLLKAAQNNYTASARLLLQHGANPNQTWVHGITPLHVAVDSKNVLLVQALLAAGADKDARSAFDDPRQPLSHRVAALLKTAGGPHRDRPPK